MSLAEDFEPILLEYRKNPALWFEEVLGVTTLEPYQRELLEDIVKYDQVAVRATHSISKTWTLARVALWFYSCFEEAIVITTAPTDRQVKTLLWGEIRDAFKKSKYPLSGRLLDKELKDTDKWYMMGFSTKKEAGADKDQKGSTFQGFHSKHVMIIFDEATGIPPDVFKMAEGLMTSGTIVKWICIANPTTRNCEFFSCFKDASWKNIHLSCFDSPNMIANGLTDKEKLEEEILRLKCLPEDERLAQIAEYKKPVPYLLTAQWVVSRVMKWGINHPLSLSKAYGEFPLDEDNVRIQFNSVQNAIDREIENNADIDRFIGVDVARFGTDKTILTDLIDYEQIGVEVYVKRDVAEVTGHVVRLINSPSRFTINTKVLVDCTGIGAGVKDNLIDLQRDGKVDKSVDIVEIHFGGKFPIPEDATDQQKK
ncbi:MAG: hypothetical protein ACE5H1_01915, partial [Thermodesulfobacteriota bacterium]